MQSVFYVLMKNAGSTEMLLCAGFSEERAALDYIKRTADGFKEPPEFFIRRVVTTTYLPSTEKT